MTAAFSQVAHAHQHIADALAIISGMRIVTTVAMPVTPPAVVIGPPRLSWTGYGQSGQPVTAQWNVYLVVSMTQYAIEALLETVASVCAAIERFTPGVVMGAGPGLYPSAGVQLPCYTIIVQMEVGMG